MICGKVHFALMNQMKLMSVKKEDIKKTILANVAEIVEILILQKVLDSILMIHENFVTFTI